MVAHLNGVQEVARSNRVSPTNQSPFSKRERALLCPGCGGDLWLLDSYADSYAHAVGNSQRLLAAGLMLIRTEMDEFGR